MKILQQKVVIPIYIIFLLVSFFYVKSVLKKEPAIEVDEKGSEETNFEVKPAVAHLDVDYGFRADSYRVRMENKDTVMDFLSYLRENEGFTYEVTSYIYGIEFDHVNGVEPGEGEKWLLERKEGDKWVDITNTAGKDNLTDEVQFRFRIAGST